MRMPWGGIRIAFRLESVKKANINFNTLFGGGCIFPSGEDSIWLYDARRKGLVFYVSNQTIGSVSYEVSSWFTGHNEHYFFGKGVFYEAVHPRSFWLWKNYFAFRTKNMTKMSASEKKKWMNYGRKAYREMLSFEDYKKKYGL